MVPPVYLYMHIGKTYFSNSI